MRGEQPGNTAEQGAAQQGGCSEQNGQQTQQAAQRITLEKDLAEAVEQGFGPVGAVGVEVIGRHDEICGVSSESCRLLREQARSHTESLFSH
ncbi:hypothetical protein D3C77_673660 [compost metagenome]